MGVIHALGSGVTGFTEGQRVAVNAVTPCFRCGYCQRRFTSECGGAVGGQRYTAQMDGTMAEYFVVPAAQANLAPILHDHPSPLQLPLDAFALGMNDKAIHTGLCPGGSERMGRLMGRLQTGRVDPTPMTTHRFTFDDIEEAFLMMTHKNDGIINVLNTFG